MNIAVTGSTGFIGSSLLSREFDDINFFPIIRQSTNKSIFVDRNIPFFVFDQNNISGLLDYFNEFNIHGVIHLASLYLKDHESDQIGELVDSNLKFSTSICEAFVKSDAKWFINTGTFWEHFNNEDYNPINLYSATKHAFQDILKYYIRRFPNKKISTLKLNDTFGPGDLRPKIFNLWNTISDTNESLKMSPGGQLIDIMYIENVLDAYLFLCHLLNGDDPYKNEYMLTSGELYTLRELADLFVTITEKSLNIEWGALPYREAENMVPWNSGNVLPGFNPRFTVKDGIRLTFCQ